MGNGWIDRGIFSSIFQPYLALLDLVLFQNLTTHLKVGRFLFSYVCIDRVFGILSLSFLLSVLYKQPYIILQFGFFFSSCYLKFLRAVLACFLQFIGFKVSEVTFSFESTISGIKGKKIARVQFSKYYIRNQRQKDSQSLTKEKTKLKNYIRLLI